jgi:hypothetical protein
MFGDQRYPGGALDELHFGEFVLGSARFEAEKPDKRHGRIGVEHGRAEELALQYVFMGEIVLVDDHCNTRRLRSYLKHGVDDLSVQFPVKPGCYDVQSIAELRKNLAIQP